MGQRSSAPSAGQRPSGVEHISTPSPTSTPVLLEASPAKIVENSGEHQKEVEIVGFPGSESFNRRLMSDTLAKDLFRCLPRDPTGSRWFLIYSSDIHGKSFNRLVQLICEKGPTIVVIKEGINGRVFGGYNSFPWLTVGARERRARSARASNARAEREGQPVLPQRPVNQQSLFFGDDRCFLFLHSNDKTVIYRPHPEINSNFMYLFDQHPDDDRIGIGMGGLPQHYGWFLDRWLEGGSCGGIRCPTFQSPMLAPLEQWPVDRVEVYAVGREEVTELIADFVPSSDGKTPIDDGSSVRTVRELQVEKVIMEMHNVHRFYGDRERDMCS